MSSELALSIDQRMALSSLRDIDHYLSRTERRLATGREVNSILDSPIDYFLAKNLSSRARDYLTFADAQEQTILALEVTLESIETIDKLLDQANAIVRGAVLQSEDLRVQSSLNLAETLRQIGLTLQTSSYAGTNLLSDPNATLRVALAREKVSLPPATTGGTATIVDVGDLAITGQNLQADSPDGLFGEAAPFFQDKFLSDDAAKYLPAAPDGRVKMFHEGKWEYVFDSTFFGLSLMATNNNAHAQIIADSFEALVEGAKERLETISLSYANSVSLLTERVSFSRTYADTLMIGSDKIVLADMNEEGANLTALRTRNQIGIETLAIASQNLSAVLTLLQN